MQELGATVSWYTMKFTDALTGYAAGWQGTMVKTVNGGLGINEIKNAGKNDLIVYPNPAGESVTIYFTSPGQKKTEVKVFDMMGKEMYSDLLTTPKASLSLLPFPNGLYFIRVATGNRIVTKKLVVSR